ncbi:hypothetical protein [Bacteriovorax sp. Seq25_V]|uniref:hypothetical protein n=1 Tax=Bacteriovorax sp. Seq25_V TaxID=1201288 RepID=UPI00038A297D|nr:hypothetical protein [Bacteriovorax sp. Seq25_V]EQC43777.1 hypothetical protein M900_1172 [Bacteriovorax sp. Seq25_V]
MRYILLVLVSLSVEAMSVEVSWNDNFSKSLTLYCEGNNECLTYFDEVTVIEEELCNDCFSTDMTSSFIFNGIGESITTGELAVPLDFFDLLKSNNFVSIDYDSPYDLVTGQSRIKKKLAYRNLCDDSSADPVLFFEKDDFGRISNPRFILCADGVYNLDLFSIDVNDDFFGIPEFY